MTNVLFYVFPHLDMPLINWYDYWDNIVKWVASADTPQIEVIDEYGRYVPQPGVVVINGNNSAVPQSDLEYRDGLVVIRG